jgi:hypothetical protein
LETLRRVQSVITEMVVPSWLGRERPPANYGTAGTGTLKGTQYAWLGKLYLPVALGTLWHPRSPQARPRPHPHAFHAFENTMYLAQALLVASRNSTSTSRQARARHHYTNYMWTLTTAPLSQYGHKHLPPNAHMSWHVFDGLDDAGPIPQTWGLAGERLIGKLQKETKNNKIGVWCSMFGPGSCPLIPMNRRI